MTQTNADWFVIVNPCAGSGKTISEWPKAEKRLEELGISHVIRFTSYKCHAVELASSAAFEGYRNILAVGGDGSVHEILTGIMSYCDAEDVNPAEFRFAVIPIGSGNDWIKSLGVPHDPDAVIELIHKDNFGRQDIVKALGQTGNCCYMANIGGAGFDSQVCVRVNAQKERGYRSKLIYLKSLLQTLIHMNSFHAVIQADGETVFDGKCFSVAFGNGQYSGGGMRQTSLSAIDDGLLDVLVIPALPLFYILKNLPKLFTGQVHTVERLIYERCRKLTLIADPSILYEIDGEVIGNTPLTLEITGKQINVLVGGNFRK